ncbi:MAG: hypothetical protein JO034_31735, partial [Singulisphaera sp.]|nr:hypothetical protein [Singulisphaera sp.]
KGEPFTDFQYNSLVAFGKFILPSRIFSLNITPGSERSFHWLGSRREHHGKTSSPGLSHGASSKVDSCFRNSSGVSLRNSQKLKSGGFQAQQVIRRLILAAAGAERLIQTLFPTVARAGDATRPGPATPT